jgi:hypothetical protein
LSSSGDLFEDIGGWGGPDEGARIGIVMLQVGFDRCFEIGNAMKDLPWRVSQCLALIEYLLAKFPKLIVPK